MPISHSPRLPLVLALLSAAPGCNLVDKVCVGDCPEAQSDGDITAPTATHATFDEAATTGVSGDDDDTGATTTIPDDPPTDCADLEDTIVAAATCEDGSAAPGELCYLFGGGSFEYPNGVASIAALQLDAAGDDVLLAHADGVVLRSLYAAGPGLSPSDSDWATSFPGTLQLSGVGDFDEDGVLDVAARLGDDGGDTILALRLDGAGGLASATTLLTGPALSTPKVADYDDDGHLDLVVADPQTGDVNVLHGDGAGGFVAALEFSYTGAKGRHVLVAFGEDKIRDDFAFAAQNGELSLYFHMIGSEGFEVVKVGTKIHDLAAADMNGDGREDIVALVDGPSGHSEVAVVLLVPSEQDTGMSFVTSYYPVHCDASVLAVGDLDADGRLDVVTVSSGSLINLATILRGDGLGLFSGVMSVQLGGPVDDLKLADLNSDGGVELLTISRDAGAYGVILSSP